MLTRTAGTGDILNGDLLPDVLARRNELRTLADYVEAVRQARTRIQAGQRLGVQQLRLDPLGVVIEKVTGHGYYDYVQHHVYAPAGLAAADPRPKAKRSRTARSDTPSCAYTRAVAAAMRSNS